MPTSQGADATIDTSAWARVLAQFVDAEGRVDFAGLNRAPADLDRYLEGVAEISPMSHPDRFADTQAVLAYHLNTYNALAMRAILNEDIPETLGGLTKYWFFGLKEHPLGGDSMTLHAYENDIIRKLGDPRVHFALNCMSVGCPRLPRTPFAAANLEQQLLAETRRFMAETRNVRVDHEERVVWLSEIFDFFPEDFLSVAPSLLAYVNRYRDEPVPENYDVRFVDYDWTVNRQPAT
ncbi:MAG: DUF547 domain-containing protein [Pseudomonadota bacterium]